MVLMILGAESTPYPAKKKAVRFRLTGKCEKTQALPNGVHAIEC
jgi:hypothetical protein